MSSPKKELFLNQYSPLMEVPFVMGVGGSFDVVAGHVKRAPLWMQEMGLEWFYRLLSEPGRMWKRYLVTNAVFLGMILKALVIKNGTTCRRKREHGQEIQS
jgi:N-acetylglucosaminyldiphosphoundecaprenol N-acetyl-beta-D-mannosaminyltransferase